MNRCRREQPAQRKFRRFAYALLSPVLWLVFCGTGCSHEEQVELETKRIDEKVTDAELERFFAVIDGLPDKKLPEFRHVFAPPPVWSSGRSRPVGELVKEELNAIEERWDFDNLKGQLRRNKRLQRVLRREEMTAEQFLGLSLALGVALSRSTVREDQNLERLAKMGKQKVEQLKTEADLFSSLSLERHHSVLQRAVWITRTDRAKRLLTVPPENLALVQAHLERLQAIFPPAYTTNPLDPVADLLAEQGIPFEESPLAGYDNQIEWSRDDAIVGTDFAAEPADEEQDRRQTSLNGGRH